MAGAVNFHGDALKRQGEMINLHVTSVEFGCSSENTRIQNILNRENITTIGELQKIERRTLDRLPNLGPKSVSIIYDKLHELGLVSRSYGLGVGINTGLEYKDRLLMRAEKIAKEATKLVEDIKANGKFFD